VATVEPFPGRPPLAIHMAAHNSVPKLWTGFGRTTDRGGTFNGSRLPVAERGSAVGSRFSALGWLTVDPSRGVGRPRVNPWCTYPHCVDSAVERPRPQRRPDAT
jgi:hypothetical protein